MGFRSLHSIQPSNPLLDPSKLQQSAFASIHPTTYPYPDPGEEKKIENPNRGSKRMSDFVVEFSLLWLPPIAIVAIKGEQPYPYIRGVSGGVPRGE
jgi:hypothetical protein